jgi:SAM-dependent methyltransferase
MIHTETMPNETVYLKYLDASHNNPVNLKRVRFIVNQANNHARQRQKEALDILDIGCGKGNISFPLASLGHHVTGVDIDPDSISQCTYKNTFPNATFMVGNAELLSETARFDVVVCSEVLEHTKSPHLVVQSIGRVLKADGILILTVPNGYSLSDLVISRLLCLGGKSNLTYRALRPIYGFVTGVSTSPSYPFCSGSLHLHFFSLRQLRKLFAEYGFVVSAIAHTDMGLPIPGAGRMGRLKGIECKLADFVPHSLAGGWLLTVKREKQDEPA